MLHLICNGLVGTCTRGPGALGGFGVRAGRSEAREGRKGGGQPPRTRASTLLRPGARRDGSTPSPNLQCLEHPGVPLAAASFGCAREGGADPLCNLVFIL